MPILTERTREFPRFAPSEEGLRLAFAAAQACIWEWELDTNLCAWSDEAWPLLGLNRTTDEPNYKNWLRSVHPDDRDSIAHIAASATQRQQAFELEWRTHPALGPVRWIMSRGQPGKPRADGRITYTGIAIDITARKRTEQEARQLKESLEQRVAERTAALSEHERLLQNILDGIPGLVGYWTKDLINRFANKAYGNWLGMPPDLIRNRHIREVIGEPLYEQNRAYMDAVLRGERQRVERNVPASGQSGDYRFSETHYLPDIVDGKVQGFLVIVFDISQIKRAELVAEAANRAKSEFLANISHEVRTPLNAMFGLAQVGARHAAGTPAARTFDQILESAQHLLTLVNDVLDFSKIEAGKLSLHSERMNLGQILDHVLALKALQAQAKGLTLTIIEAPDVPQYCHGDATRLSQILLNLLANAIKFTEFGQVSIRLDFNDPDLKITVSDTGIGMTPEKIGQLFRPFVQVHGSHPAQVGGTGLGLAITKRLVDMMDGRVTVSSEPGRGSTFSVTIPLIKPEAGDFSSLQRTALIGLPLHDRLALSSALTARGCQVQDEDKLPDDNTLDEVLVIAADMLTGLDADAIARHVSAGRQVLICANASTSIDLPEDLQCGVSIVTGPLSASRLLNAVRTKPARAPRATAHRLQGVRVLAAEDNPVNRLVLAQMLEQEGAVVTFAFDGGHALEQVRVHGASSFDVMLCDIQMPVMDGYQTAQALGHIAPRLPIIGLTAHAFDTAKQQAKKVGMVGYITKPYMLDTLVDEIHRHARRKPGKNEEPTPANTLQASSPTISTAQEPAMQQDISDWQAMQQYFRDQPQLLDRLIGMLSNTLGEIHQELEHALSTRNLDALAKVAHNVKGTALNLHTPELARLAVQTQELARQMAQEALQSAEQLSHRLGDFITHASRHQQVKQGDTQASNASSARKDQ